LKTYVINRYRDKAYRTVFLAVVIFIFLLLAGVYQYAENIAETAASVKIPDGCVCPLDRNLPIVVINTGGADIDKLPDKQTTITETGETTLYEKSDQIPVNIAIYEPYEFGFTCTCGAVPPVFSDKTEISLRGQSTLTAPKHQYTIAFTDPDGTDRPVSLLGMPAGDKWVLNGSYYDRSLIRNALALDTASQLMKWAPRYEFCELLVTGYDSVDFERDYRGVYMLEERIDRGANRVDIHKADERYEDTSFIIVRDKVKAGDYIFDSDWSAMNDLYTVGGDGRLRTLSMLVSSYPNTDVSDEYREKVKRFINDFEYALNSSDFDSPESGYRAYINVDTFIQNALISEVFDNTDGGGVSTYFYKDLSGKMSAGPIWDFDNTLMNIPQSDSDNPYGIRIIGTAWYSRLFQDDYFSERYSAVYRLQRQNVLSTENLCANIDRLVLELGPAAARNSAFWYAADNRSIARNWEGRNVPFDYDTEITEMKSYLSERLEWMDRNINLVHRVRENPE
jgi:hypothetical protein